jgi:hypothetical protein
MTAEIAILNRAAVVLAADSAVTIGQGENAKIFLTENKLFEISDTKPVGLMVYNSLDFFGVPWEVIIKDFRAKCPDLPCASMELYAKEFLQFVKESRQPSEEQQILHFNRLIASEMKSISEAFKNRAISLITTFQNNRRSVKGRRALEQLPTVLEQVLAEEKNKLSNLPDSIWFDDGFDLVTFLKKHSNLLQSSEDRWFSQFPLDKGDRELLIDYYVIFIKKSYASDLCTGLVFAGFGDQDTFCSLHSFVIDGVFCGHFRTMSAETYTVDHERNTGTVLAFAQPDVFERFAYGIDSALEASIGKFYQDAMLGIADVLIRHANMKGKRAQGTKDEIATFVTQVRQLYKQRVGPSIRAGFFQSVEAMVQLMPKQEMANLAEALVNITIIKRRASAEQESVGGPIDVAVISRHEGFVWVKRKHYFSAELNPRYFWRKYKQHNKILEEQHDESGH